MQKNNSKNIKVLIVNKIKKNKKRLARQITSASLCFLTPPNKIETHTEGGNKIIERIPKS